MKTTKERIYSDEAEVNRKQSGLSPVLGHTPQHIAKCLATGFYSGLSPIAPGTAGTLFAVILAASLLYFFGQKPSIELQLGIILGLFIIGIWASNALLHQEKFLEKDPGYIVIDEICGFFVALLGCPWTTGYILFAFVVFRFFDIIKPPPVNWAEKLPGGLGIMLDDLVAGIYASTVILFIRFIYH